MSQRNPLPQTEGGVFLTDAGLETVLIFHDGIDLPAFASFPLVEDDAGREALNGYYAPFLQLARERETGFLLSSPTWRANQDWGDELGYDAETLAHVNRQSIEMMERLRADAGAGQPILIEGMIGPRGDGYAPASTMTAWDARALPRGAAAGVRRHRRRHGLCDHDDLCRGGDRRRPGGREGRAAVGDRIHRRDRRPAAQRADAAGGDRPGGRRDGRCVRVLPDQLRAPDALRRRARRGPCRSSGSAGCGRTPRRSATPSWTRPRSSTTAIRPTSARATSACASRCRT